MNFKITIKRDGQQDVNIDAQQASITVSQRDSDDLVKVQCLVRPDSWLESRVALQTKSGVQVSKSMVIESDPVKDPNHWLKRPDGYFSKQPDSDGVRSRRSYVRKERSK